MAYQENELIAQHVALGHQVAVLAATDTYDSTQRLASCLPGVKELEGGATLIRLPYAPTGPMALRRKIRAYIGTYAQLERFAPDVIMFHGLCAWDLLSVCRYVRKNPGAVLYSDSHEDFNNSARTWLSKWLLHFGFYRTIFRSSVSCTAKVLCVSKETEEFVGKFYGCPASKSEFFPLGGVLWSDLEYAATRARVRKQYGFTDGSRVFVQSGKFDRAKKLPASLRAFSRIRGEHLRFIVAGQIMSEVKAEVDSLVASDSRISVLGWLDAGSLRELLVGADVYIQPGSQSATMQMALCCRRPVILADVPSHRVFVSGNGWLIHNEDDLLLAVSASAACPESNLEAMSEQSARVAANLLCYRKQALRVLEKC